LISFATRPGRSLRKAAHARRAPAPSRLAPGTAATARKGAATPQIKPLHKRTVRSVVGMCGCTHNTKTDEVGVNQ